MAVEVTPEAHLHLQGTRDLLTGYLSTTLPGGGAVKRVVIMGGLVTGFAAQSSGTGNAQYHSW